MPTPPNNIVVHRFCVEIAVDADNPKATTVEELENRLGDGPQWMDGVVRVIVRCDDPI